MKQSYIFRFLAILLIGVVVLTSCKKEPEPDIPETESIEEIIPGVTVGYGAEPLSKAEYEKISLIEEPMTEGASKGRIQKDPNLSPVYDLSIKMPPPANQGKLGSCTSWAVAYASRSYFNSGINNLNYFDSNGKRNDNMVFSPSYIHNQLNLGEGLGVYIWAALNLLETEGVCTWQDMPYTDYDYKTQPSTQQKQKALAYKIQKWGRVNIELNTFRKFLYYDYPVIIAAELDRNFGSSTSRDSNGEFIWKETSQYTGYHAMVVVGYDDTKRAFKVQNSWGASWANKGFIWLSYDIFDKVIKEAYVMVPGKISSHKDPVVITSKAFEKDEKITLSGQITDLGDSPIQHYGFCIGYTEGLPTNQYRSTSQNLTKAPHEFSATPNITPGRIWYRAYVQTLSNIVYGDTMSIALNTQDPGNNTSIDKDILIAHTFNSVTGIDLNNGTVLWKTASNAISSTPYPSGVFSNGRYIVQGRNLLQAINLSDGKISWQNTIESHHQNGVYPVTIGDMAYAMTDLSIYGIKAATGAVSWAKKLSTFGAVEDQMKYWGATRNLSITEDKKIAFTIRNATSGNFEKLLIMQNPSTGTDVVELYDSGSGYSTNPKFTNNLCIVRSGSNGPLVGLEISSFSKIWSSSEIIGDIAVSNNLIIGLNEKATAFIALDKNTGKRIWEYTPVEGTIVATLNDNYSSISDSYVALKVKVGEEDYVHVIDAKTGKLIWKKSIGLNAYNGTAVLVTKDKVIAKYVHDFNTREIIVFNISNGNKLWETNGKIDSDLFSVITKDGAAYYKIRSGMKQ